MFDLWGWGTGREGINVGRAMQVQSTPPARGVVCAYLHPFLPAPTPTKDPAPTVKTDDYDVKHQIIGGWRRDMRAARRKGQDALTRAITHGRLGAAARPHKKLLSAGRSPPRTNPHFLDHRHVLCWWLLQRESARLQKTESSPRGHWGGCIGEGSGREETKSKNTEDSRAQGREKNRAVRSQHWGRSTHAREAKKIQGPDER